MAEIFQPDVVKRGDYAGLGGDTSFMRAPIPDPAQFQLPVPPPVEPVPPNLVGTMGTAQTPTGPRMTQPVEEPQQPGLLGAIGSRLMEWRDPAKALEQRKQYYGKQLADPLEATMMFGPGAMTGARFSNRLNVIKKAFKRMRNMKAITPEEYTRAKGLLKHMEKEYPPEARRRLKDIEIARNKSIVAEGTAGRYWPERTAHMRPQTPVVELPEFMKRIETVPHEGGHHVFETVMDLVGEKPEQFTSNFRRLMQESLAADLPRRQEFFFHYDALSRGLDKARKTGILSGKESAEFQTEMLKAYKKAIPHEMFSNVYEKAMAEFVPGREAVRKGLQALVATRTKANKLAKQFGVIKRKLSLKLQKRVKQEETARTAYIEGAMMQQEWAPRAGVELKRPQTYTAKEAADIIRGAIGGK